MPERTRVVIALGGGAGIFAALAAAEESPSASVRVWEKSVPSSPRLTVEELIGYVPLVLAVGFIAVASAALLTRTKLGKRLSGGDSKICLKCGRIVTRGGTTECECGEELVARDSVRWSGE